jgi:hypothetical protein
MQTNRQDRKAAGEVVGMLCCWRQRHGQQLQVSQVPEADQCSCHSVCATEACCRTNRCLACCRVLLVCELAYNPWLQLLL